MGGETFRLVTSNNVDVFRLLGTQTVARLGLDYVIAADQAELLALVKRHKPHVVLVDIELAGGSGYDACRRLKADPDAAETHVVLLLTQRAHGPRLDRAVIDRVAAAGADDVMAMPLHPDDFYFHLAHLSGLAVRRDRRIGVDLELAMPRPDGALAGRVVNVGAGGVGVHLPEAVPTGSAVTVRFHAAGLVTPDTAAFIAWCRALSPSTAPPAEGDDPHARFAAGLRFDGEPPIKTRLLLEQVALFDVVTSDDATTVILHGDFTEMTSFAALTARLTGIRELEFDLAGVRYLSSAGVRAWCQFLAGLDGVRYHFRHASVAFATQAAMVPLVLGEGPVVSLEAPYFCGHCDREDLRLLETSLIVRDGDRVLPPRLSCGTCHHELIFDDVPERYFAFIEP